MAHGALFQARQALQLVRYLPRWQQNLLAVVLLVVGISLLAFGELVGLAPLAAVALFVITRVRRRTASLRAPGN